MRTSRLAAALAVVALAGACSSGSDTASEPEATQEPTTAATTAGPSLRIASFNYSSLSVAPGTEITVTNSDNAVHTVTSETKGLFNVTVEKGTPATFKAPATAGAYQYVCTIHSSMHGTLTVTG